MQVDIQFEKKRWRISPNLQLRAQAAEIIDDIKKRLREPRIVREQATVMAHQSQYPAYRYWLPSTASMGDAGMAIMCSHLHRCFPYEEWDQVGFRYLKAATSSPVSPSISVGLLSGLSGLGVAALHLSNAGEHYRGLVDSIDYGICERARKTLLIMQRRFEVERQKTIGGAPHETDIVSGLAGAAIYMSERALESNECRKVLGEVAKWIMKLVDDLETPSWKTPFLALIEEADRELFPHGKMNMGFSHGLPGLIAGLSSAARVLEDSQILESIAKATEWLVHHREDDRWGPNWPTAYRPSYESGITQLESPFGPSRCAWCYGVPGIAIALCEAAAVTDTESFRTLAVDAIRSVQLRPLGVRRIDSPTICHGVSGLLQIVLRIMNLVPNAGLVNFVDELLEQVISNFEIDSRFGYRHQESETNYVDNPTLLDGAAGVLLALCSATFEVEPKWDLILGIHGAW